MSITGLGDYHLFLRGSGQVAIGQKVNIRFDNFPDYEFGIIRGTVINC